MAKGLNFNDFPLLHINSEDATGSWNAWLTEFELSVEMVTLKLGTETIDSTEQNVFRGRMKLLALLHAVGKDGRDVLQSLGFDLKSPTSSYDEAMEHLQKVYGTQESVYVKIMKLVTVNQALGENESDYLLRVEKLSRTVDVFRDDNARKEFSLALAVNGLRESSVRKQLMQRSDLDWQGLSDDLRARKLARESEKILECAKSQPNIKQEVKQVTSKLADYSQLSSDSYDERQVSRISKGKSKKQYKHHESSRRYSRDYSNSSRGSGSDLDMPEWRRSSRDTSKERFRRSDRKSKKLGSSRYTSPKRDDNCFGCLQAGHQVRNCPLVRCFICNEKGHTSQDCKLNSSRNRDRHRRRDRYVSRSDSASSASPRRVRFTDSKS